MSLHRTLALAGTLLAAGCLPAPAKPDAGHAAAAPDLAVAGSPPPAPGGGSGSGSGDGHDGGVPARDDGGNGGGGSASAIGCDDASLLFCEDFEHSAAGSATSAQWTPSTNNGTLTVDGTHAYGAQALHVHAAGGGFAYIKPNHFAPPGNSFYGRLRLWATAFPSAPDYAHFTLVEAAGAGAGLVRPIGGQYIPPPTAGKSLWGVGSDQGATGDWTSWQPSAPTAAGRWLCLEWRLDASANEVDVWIDGVAQPDLTVSTKVHGGSAADFVFPAFDSIWFGWWLYQSGSTPSSFDLWLDDLALSANRVGC